MAYFGCKTNNAKHPKLSEVDLGVLLWLEIAPYDSACDSFGSLFFFDEVEAAACFDALLSASLLSLFFRLSARSFILASRREDLSASKPDLEGDDEIVSSAIKEKKKTTSSSSFVFVHY